MTRARDRGGDDPEEPDLPPAESDERIEVKDLKRVLEEIRGEPSESEKRSRAKSPGQTPKSSIHRNLAKAWHVGLPGQGRTRAAPRTSLINTLRAVLWGYSRRTSGLAVERGIPLKEVTAELVRQATKEQDRGQKGLTKFVKAWQRGSTAPSTPSSAPFEYGAVLGGPREWRGDPYSAFAQEFRDL